MPIALIVLAAGQGTRMKSDRPKVLHEIGGAPLVAHAIRAGWAVSPERVVVVAGRGADEVARAVAAWDETAEVVIQAEQKGTAHAVAQAAPALTGFKGDALVLYGDTPFIRPETLASMAEARNRHDVVLLGFEAADPGRYGRLVVEGGELRRIVEWKDATAAERAIGLCNSGVVMADAGLICELVAAVRNDNAAEEFYLTDIVALARAQGRSAGVVTCDEGETLGVNTRSELLAAERLFQERARAAAIDDGVEMPAPETVIFALDTAVGRDAVIEPHVVFGPGVTVESGARIRAFSHLEGAHVSRGAIVGPYARLRPGAELAEDVHVGNFVEIKNATLGEGAKANHLSYIGDATVGARANIGAGTVTCNYDGVFKHRTEIGARAFIGSDTMLIAPVRIGDDAMTASGSVITQDVPEGALGLGRSAQVNKPGFARRFMEKLKAAKAKKG